MSEDQREAFGEMENEAKLNLLYSLGLFPACGHHRVVASKELAEESEENAWMVEWTGVKVIAPPAGAKWVSCVRILGFYDNLPFGTRLSFAEQMKYLRREYVTRYMPRSGYGFKNPGPDRKALRKKIEAILQTHHSQTVTSAMQLLVRPPAIYTLINRILVGDVKNPEVPFCTLGGPTTLHHLAPLPDDMVESLLLQVIDRKIGLAEANMQAKNVRALCCAREHTMRYLRTIEPARTKHMIDWDHFTKVWPTLEEVADKARGYWLNQKGKVRPKQLPALDRQIEARIKWDDEMKAGKMAGVTAQRDNVPFLIAPESESGVLFNCPSRLQVDQTTSSVRFFCSVCVSAFFRAC